MTRKDALPSRRSPSPCPTWLWLLLTLPVWLAACGGGQETPAEAGLSGQAVIAAPLQGSRVEVLAADQRRLDAAPAESSEQGLFEFDNLPLPATLRVVVYGGMQGPIPFEGRLMADVENPSPGVFVRVNPVTTLVARYRDRQPGTTLAQARAAIAAYLGASDAENVERDASYNPRWFSALAFRNEALMHGDFDEFVDLAVDEAAQGMTRRFSLVQGAADLIADFLKWGFKQIASGATSAVGGKGASALMDLLFPDPTAARLDEIRSVLAQVSSDISRIGAQVVGMRSELNNLTNLVADNLWLTGINEVFNAQTTIDLHFEAFQRRTVVIDGAAAKLAMATEGSPEHAALKTTYNEKVALLTGDFRTMASVAAGGLPQALATIHARMIGGSASAVPPLLDLLVRARLEQGESPETVYGNLRALFTSLVAFQVKGLYVLTPAIGKVEGEDEAAQLLMEFRNDKLPLQVRLFLQAAERLAMHDHDTRRQEFDLLRTSSIMTDAYRLAAGVLDGYRMVDGTTLDVSSQASVTVGLVTVVPAGASASFPAEILLQNKATGNTVPALRLDATTPAAKVRSDGADFTVARYQARGLANGSYTVAVTDFHPKYSAPTVTIGNLDAQRHAALRVATWALRADDSVAATTPRYQVLGQRSGLAMAILGRTTIVEGSRVQQWQRNVGFIEQEWTRESAPIRWCGSGIRNLSNGMLLMVPTTAVDGEPVRAAAGWPADTAGLGCSAATLAPLQWSEWLGWGDVSYTPTYGKDDLRLSLAGATTSASMNGAQAVLRKHADVVGHAWWRPRNARIIGFNGESAEYSQHMINTGSGMSLEVVGLSDVAEGHVQVLTPNRELANQRWSLRQRADGHYGFVNDFGAMNIDLWAGDGADGARVASLAWNNDHPNQLWRIDAAGATTVRRDGRDVHVPLYRILNKATGKPLAVRDGALQDGAEVLQWSWDGKLDKGHMLWRFDEGR